MVRLLRFDRDTLNEALSNNFDPTSFPPDRAQRHLVALASFANDRPQALRLIDLCLTTADHFGPSLVFLPLELLAQRSRGDKRQKNIRLPRLAAEQTMLQIAREIEVRAGKSQPLKALTAQDIASIKFHYTAATRKETDEVIRSTAADLANVQPSHILPFLSICANTPSLRQTGVGLEIIQDIIFEMEMGRLESKHLIKAKEYERILRWEQSGIPPRLAPNNPRDMELFLLAWPEHRSLGLEYMASILKSPEELTFLLAQTAWPLGTDSTVPNIILARIQKGEILFAKEPLVDNIRKALANFCTDSKGISRVTAALVLKDPLESFRLLRYFLSPRQRRILKRPDQAMALALAELEYTLRNQPELKNSLSSALDQARMHYGELLKKKSSNVHIIKPAPSPTPREPKDAAKNS